MTPEQKKALAIASARLRLQAKSAPAQTNVPEQLGSGLNEGLASFAGLPVDAVTGALNLGAKGINYVAGTEIPPIENPVGGSTSIRNALDPFITEAAPQSMPQRYARRIGQEAGFGVPMAATTAALPGVGAMARANMPAFMATSGAGDVGSAVAGQTSQEIAPGNAIADIVASLVGGAAGAGSVAAMTPEYGAVPSTSDLQAKASELWDRVKSSEATLTDDATARLGESVKGALPTSQLAPESYPNAFRSADLTANLKNPTVYDVVEARRIIGDNVAADPKEARVGSAMKAEILDYLNGLKPTDVNGDASGVVDDVLAANNTTARVKRAQEIENAGRKGESRAATSGTGGNEVNTIRQNVRAIFDRERDVTKSGKRSGYTPDEMAAMEKVVMGSPASNLARMVGRMAPTSGALPMMATGIGGAAGMSGALASGNPLMAIPAIAGGIGFAGKAVAENLTQRDIARLLATIQGGGKPAASSARQAAQLAIVEQLLSTAGNQQPR